MPRYFIAVQYIGTAYNGFQSQPNGRAIQDVLNNALAVLLKTNIETTTSSRTDAGVHALENYLHFDWPNQLHISFQYNLNCILPQDISVITIIAVQPTAHSRFDALSRTYRYAIHQSKQPFLFKRSYFYPFPLDLNIMQSCAAILLKHLDYTSFSKKNTQVNNYNCQITHAEWVYNIDGTYSFTVTSNRFLRGMVRGLVTTMLKAGRGKITLQEFENIILAKDCSKADFSAPGEGLFLEKVAYDWQAIKL